MPFAIPGERVRVRLPVRDSGAGPLRAHLEEVVEPSPHRVTPTCPHFGHAARGGAACGGCAWQHIAYDEQLRLKTAVVEAVVRQAAAQAPRVRPMRSAHANHPWAFRHKVHFVFGNDGRNTLAMGHLARGSRRLVPVESCPVHAKAGNVEAFAWRDAFRQAGVHAWDGARGGASLRGVAVRVAHGTGERLTTLVAAHDRDARLRDATRRHARGRGGEPGARVGLHLNVHARDDGFIFGPGTRRLEGADRVREEVAGTVFLISPTAFFQTNIGAAELLVRLVVEAVPDGASVLDLYAGAGLFALPLARLGHQVVAVEENRAAVADGQASQRLNRIPSERCRWVAGPVEAALARARAADAVVLDPPREGCGAGVLQAMLHAATPQVVVYVSCNPATLARDVRIVARRGYEVDSVQPVDMFPHTPHIETVVVFRRGTP